MNSIATLTPKQLRRAADLQERILSLQQELADIVGASAEAATAEPKSPGKRGRGRGRKKRTLSPEGLANIRAGVRKREAAKKGASSDNANRGRSEAMKRRWAEARAKGATRV